jgi:hypothetical protein
MSINNLVRSHILPAVFTINGNNITIFDQNNDSLTVQNLGFTIEKKGRVENIVKWKIIISPISGKPYLMSKKMKYPYTNLDTIYYYQMDIKTYTNLYYLLCTSGDFIMNNIIISNHSNIDPSNIHKNALRNLNFGMAFEPATRFKFTKENINKFIKTDINQLNKMTSNLPFQPPSIRPPPPARP